MKSIVNVTADSRVYIDDGSYNCTIITGGGNSGYQGRVFILMANTSDVLFVSNDTNTYPVILSDSSDGNNISFYFYANVIASFYYLRFHLGPNTNYNRRLLMSLFIIVYYCFFFFFSICISE
jgi:hypothetical protein